jgi:serine/threonine protein kinase
MGCSLSDQNAQTAELPAKLYQQLERLGQGKRSQVHRVFDGAKKVEYAQKIITGLPLEIDPKVIINEATKVFERIQDLSHPNLLLYECIFFKPDSVCLLMELSPLGTLEQQIEHKGRLPEKMVARYSKQMLEGLNYLHEHGLLHNNVKPSNVLLFSKDKIKLADFCLANVLD